MVGILEGGHQLGAEVALESMVEDPHSLCYSFQQTYCTIQGTSIDKNLRLVKIVLMTVQANARRYAPFLCSSAGRYWRCHQSENQWWVMERQRYYCFVFSLRYVLFCSRNFSYIGVWARARVGVLWVLARLPLCFNYEKHQKILCPINFRALLSDIFLSLHNYQTWLPNIYIFF